VLILLTDGRDVRSLATFDDAVRSAGGRDRGLRDRPRSRLHAAARRLANSPAASSTPARARRRSRAIYHRIGGELDRTWRISYTTGARPVTGSPLGIGSAPAPSVVLPGRDALGRTSAPALSPRRVPRPPARARPRRRSSSPRRQAGQGTAAVGAHQEARAAALRSAPDAPRRPASVRRWPFLASLDRPLGGSATGTPRADGRDPPAISLSSLLAGGCAPRLLLRDRRRDPCGPRS
jgi:hypothetical protein